MSLVRELADRRAIEDALVAYAHALAILWTDGDPSVLAPPERP